MKAVQSLEAIASGLASVFIPRTCPACGRRLPASGAMVCVACLLALPRCTTDVTHSAIVSNGPAPAGLSASWIQYLHGTESSRLIRAVKYKGRPALGRHLGRLFAAELLERRERARQCGPDLPPLPQVLIPVPLHWTKRLERGFNQSEQIAEGMAEVLGCTVDCGLRATRSHGTQTRRKAEERAANVRSIFVWRGGDSIDGLDAAIVDDIITTGATARECVLALGLGGARPSTIGLLSLGLAGEQ